MGGPALAAACPRRNAESSVVEITLTGLGTALKIKHQRGGPTNLMEGTYQDQYRQGGESIRQTTCFSRCSAIFGRDDSGED